MGKLMHINANGVLKHCDAQTPATCRATPPPGFIQGHYDESKKVAVEAMIQKEWDKIDQKTLTVDNMPERPTLDYDVVSEMDERQLKVRDDIQEKKAEFRKYSQRERDAVTDEDFDDAIINMDRVSDELDKLQYEQKRLRAEVEYQYAAMEQYKNPDTTEKQYANLLATTKKTELDLIEAERELNLLNRNFEDQAQTYKNTIANITWDLTNGNYSEGRSSILLSEERESIEKAESDLAMAKRGLANLELKKDNYANLVPELRHKFNRLESRRKRLDPDN